MSFPCCSFHALMESCLSLPPVSSHPCMSPPPLLSVAPISSPLVDLLAVSFPLNALSLSLWSVSPTPSFSLLSPASISVSFSLALLLSHLFLPFTPLSFTWFSHSSRLCSVKLPSIPPLPASSLSILFILLPPFHFPNSFLSALPLVAQTAIR